MAIIVSYSYMCNSMGTFLADSDQMNALTYAILLIVTDLY